MTDVAHRLSSQDEASDSLAEIFDRMDHTTSSVIAAMTGGLAPSSPISALADWAMHFALVPGRQLRLVTEGGRQAARLAAYMAEVAVAGDQAPVAVAPQPQDHRFDGPAWREWPFGPIGQAFLLQQQWWDAVLSGVPGVTAAHEARCRFLVRQFLDAASPSNIGWLNPEVIERIVATGGFCLLDGAANAAEDARRTLAHERPVGEEGFRLGIDVATTPGKVVLRNRLIELIQYSPTTAAVHATPILIVPAWIMKYYILDLSPHNSLVRWLVGQGHTVFMISWRNPDASDRDLTLEDYRQLGPMAALDAIGAITGAAHIHAAGYCLGGTLLAIAAATMARDGDTRLASMTLLAAQTEFSEPGELGLFIDEAQVHLLEEMMRARGYLDPAQMSGAFQMLRSNDLVWSRLVREYLMGERTPMNDLAAWNSDGTRMPFAMHSQYLRSLFLNDDLAEGRFHVGGRPIALEDIRVPIFAVGTEWDHVAPWRSVYKILLLTQAAARFVLTSGGHNAGIVSEPGHAGRRYRVFDRAADGAYVDPDTWLTHAVSQEGSWWVEWNRWLIDRNPEMRAPVTVGAASGLAGPHDDAPGTYVLMP
ncbi:MAG: PHA/PHB synthase family protein [Sphingomonas sp.]|uniref:PHA/PHB synthase family protein n=1 Tax=Sphingomonas sp. TaxID=28214 RepID=UPI003BF0C62D